MGSIWGPKIEVPLSFKLQKIDVWNFHHWLPPTKYFHVQGHLKVKSRSEANFFKTLDRDVGFSVFAHSGQAQSHCKVKIIILPFFTLKFKGMIFRYFTSAYQGH